ncbi:MAG: SusC/RagA family TonB-linked outer membrane protein, partial [Bacteroidales bacterium]
MRRLTLFLAFLMIGVSYLAAQTKASGVVISAEDNLPVIGASVVIKGTTIGTVTDFDGNFTLDIPQDASKTLVFSYVGLQSKEEAAKSDMRVILSSSSQSLDEVIVVAYGTAKKSSFTGSASSVKADALSVPSVESVDKALAGKVSGVRVASTTGDPGAAGEIQVRGIGSISSSTSPLYVIDGVPVENGNFNSRASSNILSSLNPNDIESLTVLKDAAAASLYGSRAANGVVIITTKRGKEGKVNVNLQANFGVSSMATNSYEIMSGTEYYDYSKLALMNEFDYLGGVSGYNSPEDYALAQLSDRGVSRADGEDWRDYIYKHGQEQNYQVSISGGSAKSKYYTSFGYQDIQGLARGTDFKRYSGVVNLNNELADWLSMDVKTQLSKTDQKGYRDQSGQSQGIGYGTPLGLLQQANPSKTLKDENGEYNTVLMGRGINPYYELNGKDKFLRTENFRALGNLNFTVKFTKDLSFKTTNGVDFSNAFINEYWGPNTIDGGGSVKGMG